MASDRSAQITLRALVTARWVLLGLMAAAGLTVALVPGLVAPLLRWFPETHDHVQFAWLWAAWAVLVVRRAR